MDLGSFYGQMTAYNTYGVNPGAASGAPEMAPPVSHMAGDKGAVPWHPDSPTFWLVLIGTASLLGIAGASINLRAGPARAGASLGKA